MSTSKNRVSQQIDFADEFQVCWAGPNPLAQRGFCFGSEEGQLLFVSESGEILGPPFRGSPAQEAVNGVAAVGNVLAVSTRADVSLFQKEPVGVTRSTVHAGAHGVIATPTGSFVASAGLGGWMILDPGTGVKNGTVIAPHAGERQLYIYRTIAFHSPMGKEVLACATRTGGVGVATFARTDKTQTFNTASFRGLDVIDVCAIGDTPDSLALVAADRDGTLVFFRDILTDKKPQTVRFKRVSGTVYKVMSCRGHVLVLTSDGLYVLLHLASRFLSNKDVNNLSASTFVLPVVAVDANLVRDRYVLIVTDENTVVQADMEAIERDDPAAARVRDDEIDSVRVSHFDPTYLEPEWEYGAAQETRRVPVG